jgi:sugar phosphate isomerase/epimerase
MKMAWRLTGFADEIATSLDEQISTMTELGIKGLDLRNVDGVHVLQLTEAHIEEIQAKLHHAGMYVSTIGSPVNKVPYDPLNEAAEFEKLRRSLQIGAKFNCTRVRIFTPEFHGDDPSPVLSWMAGQRRLAEEYEAVLIHENDAKYWAAYPDNAKRLFQELASPNFKAAFDFANTVLIGFRPWDDWFPWIVPYLDTIHIKDAKDGAVTVAGSGDGQILETLKYLNEQGWSGPLTLEPHLASVGNFGGYSGSQLFTEAANALRGVMAAAGIVES